MNEMNKRIILFVNKLDELGQNVWISPVRIRERKAKGWNGYVKIKDDHAVKTTLHNLWLIITQKEHALVDVYWMNP